MDPQAVKSGFDAAKAALDTLKSLREMFRGDPARHKEVGQQLDAAERELRLAEAQIAQALGYALCRAHTPCSDVEASDRTRLRRNHFQVPSLQLRGAPARVFCEKESSRSID